MNNQDSIAYEEFQGNDKYIAAQKQVKRLKGFYTHFMVYVIINIVIIFINLNNVKEGESYFKPENFFTAFFWGIGLLSHALSVFMPNWIFGKKWEEKKIKELIEKEKSDKWE